MHARARSAAIITAACLALSSRCCVGFLPLGRPSPGTSVPHVAQPRAGAAPVSPGTSLQSMTSGDDSFANLSRFNQVIIVGNLGRDPELRYLDSGTCVLSVGIAVAKGMPPGAAGMGDGEDTADWINVEAWGGVAEDLAQSARKGSKLLVIGKLTTNKWTDKYGQSRTDVKVRVSKAEVLRSKGSSNPELKYNQGWDQEFGEMDQEYVAMQQQMQNRRFPKKGGNQGGYSQGYQDKGGYQAAYGQPQQQERKQGGGQGKGSWSRQQPPPPRQQPVMEYEPEEDFDVDTEIPF